MNAPFLLDSVGQHTKFPEVDLACQEPNGLLAIGGDLSVPRLLSAYRQGIFPWFNEDQPILWWAPDPRAVLYPKSLKISKSLRKILRRREFSVRIDTCFRQVVQACAEPRVNQSGTWIVPKIIDAYSQLHQHGIAHSVETWYQGELVGGLYGVAVGRVFCGESMFSWRSNASKVALVGLAAELVTRDYLLIDCQLASSHLTSLGAELISRQKFCKILHLYCDLQQNLGKWDQPNTAMQSQRVKNAYK